MSTQGLSLTSLPLSRIPGVAIVLVVLCAIFGVLSPGFTTPANIANILEFEKRYPEIKLSDYIYGALAFNPDAKAQYDSIMEFPPFLEEIDKFDAAFFNISPREANCRKQMRQRSNFR